MKSPKFVVVGYPRAGKSTLAEFLSEELKRNGLPHEWGDTSTELIDFVAAQNNVTVAEINSAKEVWRPKLIETGDRLTDESPTALSKPILDRGAVVAGVRRAKELESLRSTYVDLVVIWVDRPDHGVIPDNTEIRPEHCDFTVVARDRSELRKAALYIVSPLATILHRRVYAATGIK